MTPEEFALTLPSVLVVEDDPVQRSVLRAMLRSLGARSVGAENLEQARNALSREDISTIVLDLNLGEGSGIDLLAMIDNSVRPKTLILVSGCDERTRVAACTIADELGIYVAGSISKPVKLPELAQLLDLSPLIKNGGGTLPGPIVSAGQLAQALRSGEIVAEFQPKISFVDGMPTGAEALARWTSVALGNVRPDVFIPLAEASGQIRRVTAAILEQSLIACSTWRRTFPHLTVAVNISAGDVDKELYALIRDCLSRYALPSTCLVLEITESMVLSDTVSVREILTKLRIDGVALSIDDFGTGYGNLVSLLKMPFSELKLDRLFVASTLADRDEQRILKALISLGKEMGLRTVAEGIETEEVAARLKSYGCDQGQGWLWAPSLSAAAFETWVRRKLANHEVQRVYDGKLSDRVDNGTY